MGIHLHEFVSAAHSNKILLHHNVSSTWIREQITPRVSSAKSAMCFDAGDLAELPTMFGNREVWRLPYETVWVELSAREQEITYGYLASEPGGRLTFDVWARSKSGQWHYFHQCRLMGEAIQVLCAMESLDRDTSGAIARNLLSFLSALNCTNTKQVLHKPSAARQSARHRKGKQPLFSYWTLTLPEHAPASSARRITSSDRNGPRVHLRRGHIRRYAPGKYCWVQPHAVGHKKLGMVHKDYAWKADGAPA